MCMSVACVHNLSVYSASSPSGLPFSGSLSGLTLAAFLLTILFDFFGVFSPATSRRVDLVKVPAGLGRPVSLSQKLKDDHELLSVRCLTAVQSLTPVLRPVGHPSLVLLWKRFD